MPIPSQPPRLENVIGTQADVFTIPETTPEGTAALSYQSGWPAKSATALSAGGVPPQREYFNAVNKMLSQHVFFQQSGSLYQWNNQNNYLQGAHILGSNGKEYVARQQSGPDTSAGVQDPVQDTNGTYWTSAGSSVAAGGGGLETDENGQLYVAKLKTPRSLDGVNFDGSAPVTRFAQCSTAAGTAAKTVTISNFTLVEGATIMVLFNNTNTASNPTLNVSNTGAHPIQWRKAGVSPSWLAANRLYALTYTGSAWQIQGDLTEACIQDGGGLSVDEDGKLFVPLKFTGKGILEHLKEGVEELSASYSHNLRLDETGTADFVAVDIMGNHVALVERGRCGSEVRVFNNNEVDKMRAKNEIALLVDGKKIDLAKFFSEEQQEDAHQDGSITDNEEIDKRKVIDEIGGILKGKGLDEEIIRTVIGLAEKLSYDKSEAGTSDNECEIENEDPEVEKEDDEKEEKAKSENASVLISALKKEMAENNAALRRAYNSAVELTGEDFPAIGLSVRQIYEHALKTRNIETSNRSIPELAAICETLKSVRVDNSFTPSRAETVAEDEIEINI